MYEEMSEQRQEYTVPEPVEEAAGEEVCQKTHAEEGDEFLIYG